MIFDRHSFDTFWGSYVLTLSDIMHGQVPTKVCKKEEVPLCTKQEVAETKKVKPNTDLFESAENLQMFNYTIIAH